MSFWLPETGVRGKRCGVSSQNRVAKRTFLERNSAQPKKSAQFAKRSWKLGAKCEHKAVATLSILRAYTIGRKRKPQRDWYVPTALSFTILKHKLGVLNQKRNVHVPKHIVSENDFHANNNARTKLDLQCTRETSGLSVLKYYSLVLYRFNLTRSFPIKEVVQKCRDARLQERTVSLSHGNTKVKPHIKLNEGCHNR